MKRRKQDLVLGLAALVFLALFLATVLFLAPSLGEATRPIVVHFRHEEGLAPLKANSLVLLSGAIEVGHVTSAAPREIDGRTVIAVEAEINESLPLYDDCEITTEMALIGGVGTMVIANVGRSGVEVASDDIIVGQPPQGMAAFSSLSRGLMGLVDRVDGMLDPDEPGALLNKIMVSLADVNAMTAELRTQISTAEQQTLLGKIHLILDDLNVTTAAVRDQMRTDDAASLVMKFHAALEVVHQDLLAVQTMLTENRPLVHNTLASVEHAARVIDEEMIGGLRGEFDPANPAALLAKLHVAMDHLNASLADIQIVSAAGKRMVVLSRPEVERILANVGDMSEVLTQTSKDIQLNPAKLFWGPGDLQKSKLGIFAAARDFAQAATYLDDAAARLEAILEVAPQGARLPESDKELREMYESLRSAFERFRRAEAFFWDQMK